MTPPIEAHDDDKPVGRVLSRREVLALLGGASAAVFAIPAFSKLNLNSLAGTPTPAATSTPLPACVVRPELTEGPYFVENELNRSDIRIDPSDGSVKEGAPLRLVYRVSEISANACTPLAGSQVDVWHCDALGVYSGVNDPGFDTSGQLWLRGYQITDETGTAEFMTIYPGWYSGRTVHIHFKIRTDPDADQGYEFTSQLFFDEAMSDKVLAEEPYASRGYRNTLNAEDGIFQASDGLLTLQVLEEEDGYAAIFDIGLDLSQSTQAQTGGNGGRPGGAPPGGAPPRGTPPGAGQATPTPSA
jgi:protocatechuate 3,4-dioxygenase beta subunit